MAERFAVLVLGHVGRGEHEMILRQGCAPDSLHCLERAVLGKKCGPEMYGLPGNLFTLDIRFAVRVVSKRC